MTLEIKRTPDSVKLTDTDVRDAILDYIEKHAGRQVLDPANDGIRYHASHASSINDNASGKTYERIYVTVQLQDAMPKPKGFDFGEPAPTLGDALDEAVAQLKRYGGEPKLRQIVEVVEALAAINDDIAHDRSVGHEQFHALRSAAKNLQTRINNMQREGFNDDGGTLE